MNVRTAERKLISGIKDLEGLDEVRALGIHPDKFNHYGNVFKFIEKFVDKYNNIPSRESIKEKFDGFKFAKSNGSDSKYFVDLVLAASAKRDIKDVMSDAMTKIKEGEDAFKIATFMADQVSAIHKPSKGGGLTDAGALGRLSDYKKRRRIRKAGKIIGVRTGLDIFDDDLIGWQEGNFIVFIGPPEVGKTWILMKEALVAYFDGLRVLYVSPEMPRYEVEYRWDTLYSRMMDVKLSNEKLLQARIKPSKYRKWLEDVSKRDDWMTVCTDEFDEEITIDTIKHLINTFQPDVIAIDTVPALCSSGFTNDWSELTNIGYELKRLAKRTGKVILSVLPTIGATYDTEDPPGLADIAIGKYIAYAGDLILSIAFDYHNEGIRYIAVPKRRGGKRITEKVELKFLVDKGIIEQTKIKEA